jgi:hypothetical protein
MLKSTMPRVMAAIRQYLYLLMSVAVMLSSPPTSGEREHMNMLINGINSILAAPDENGMKTH